MNTSPSAHSILIAETHIEICGHAFHGCPTIDELATILGHTYRTIQDAATYMWIWDDLGTAALSWTFGFDRSDPDQHKVANIWFVVQTVVGDNERPRQIFPGKITIFGESWTPSDNPHEFVKAIRSSSQHLGISPRQDISDTWSGINDGTQTLRGGGKVFLLDPSTDPTVSPNSPHEVSITYFFPRSPQDIPYSERMKTELAQLILTHLERERPAGRRLIIRSQIRQIPTLTAFLIVIAFAIYLGFASVSFTHSVWLSVLLAYAVGGGLVYLVGNFGERLGRGNHDLDINIRDASFRIAADICQSFPARKPRDIEMDFLQLWGTKAFYDSAPWSQLFPASSYAYLLISGVYDQLAERVSLSIKSAGSPTVNTAHEAPVQTESEAQTIERNRQATAPPDSNTCRYCGHLVSPRAAECPNCGEPFVGSFFRVNRLTNEQTGKGEKIAAVFARLILIAALVALPFDFVFYGGAHFLILLLLIATNLCLRLFLRIGRWWHHE